VSKDKQGVVTRERLTRKWTDWVDYWAVDFDYMSRKEIIKVARDMGVEGYLPGIDPVQGNLVEFEERWTGGYIFENEWQSFRTRQDLRLNPLNSACSGTARPSENVESVRSRVAFAPARAG
jgi:site-specific DNA-methyltransferase (adenine-specific)/adenine-specific DNA-methyltransferase